MKDTPTSESDRLLEERLREWTLDAPLPTHFREQVWNRIARAEADRPPSLWSRLIQVLSTSIHQPRIAYSYAAVLLALGIAAGSLTAQAKSSRLENELGRRYVQSIDPYQMTMPAR